MKKVIAAAALMAVLLAYTGCGDSATAVTGTLPIITGIAVDTLASVGDTIVVMWNPIDSTLVEGYFLWTRTGIEGPWVLAATSERSPAVHIASSAAYYTVMAYNGENTSSEPGLSDNTKTTGLLEIRRIFEGRAVGFRVDLQGDSLIAGDPGSPDFNQQFVVSANMLLERHIYPGNANPDMWPGGARTRISNVGGRVAPAPTDTTLWKDSVLYGGNFFLELDNNYYCLLSGSQTLPDTASMSDTLVIDGQLQSIRGVRVFND